MRMMILALGAAATALASPVLAQGRGHGQGHGNDKAQAAGERGRGGGNSGGQGAGQRGGRGDDGKARGGRGAGNQARPAHTGGNAGRVERQAQARDSRGHGRGAVADRTPGPSRGTENRRNRLADRNSRRVDRRAVVVTDRGAIARLRYGPRMALVRGCPPGLARKNNGCLPPGHARRLAARRDWYGNWWRSPGDGLYRYDGGYLWRLQPNGAVAGFIPLAGGALWPGNRWPARYSYSPVPDYYADYYGYNDPYSYRYADGVIYGMDPQTETIRQIAGLLAGDDWGIGQRMPAGYGVYNVPYAYRDRYYDTPDDMYRYSDGYMYRVDPTTQLIQAAIQLIA